MVLATRRWTADARVSVLHVSALPLVGSGRTIRTSRIPPLRSAGCEIPFDAQIMARCGAGSQNQFRSRPGHDSGTVYLIISGAKLSLRAFVTYCQTQIKLLVRAVSPRSPPWCHCATCRRTLAADVNRLFAHEADENVLSGG